VAGISDGTDPVRHDPPSSHLQYKYAHHPHEPPGLQMGLRGRLSHLGNPFAEKVRVPLVAGCHGNQDESRMISSSEVSANRFMPHQ